MKYLLIILISFKLFAFDITVNVNNLRNSKGVVQFNLYNKNNTIPDKNLDKYYKKIIAYIHNKSASVTFTNIPKGIYAISILHDENQNHKIDKGFMLPKEGIGFSNYNKINLFNKPNFKKASFKIDSNISKTIKVIYF